ncbi:hypothetical protein SLS60_004336 [Paraconiothyrium brasiliense]|uniref:Alcohol dehydrogenase-like C-terminal domain-containing protein n=1 Tax=Paraconiothyrium brasiliense TaxID=300254 RepID=A0ABR3RK23_9PLEO
MPDACQNQKNFPKHYDGTFQEYVTAPWTSLMPLDPINLDSALKALRESNIRKNDVVLIWGIGGGIGHLAGMMARKIFGASVIGVDHADKILELEASTRHQLCDNFVAASKILGNNDGFAAQVYKTCIGLRGGRFEPKQPDVIIVAASSEEPYRWINLVRDGGIVACLIVLSSTATLSVQIAEFVERQICIKGVMMGGAAESYQVMQ